jgi:hypothetical protein
MIEEAYVSFETAKLLKEKGFDESCEGFYVNSGVLSHTLSNANNSKWDGDKSTIGYISAPTHQMAMAWLMEVHKLYINIWADPKDVENNDFDIIFRAQVYNGTSNYGTHEFSTYEQACEASIKYCLENLI